jgi:hypothetical protein
MSRTDDRRQGNSVNTGRTDSRPDPARGEVLVCLERSYEGRRQRLRVSLESFEGHPYVQIQVWNRGQDGRWVPTPKCVTARAGELARVVDALRDAQTEILRSSAARLDSRRTAAGGGTPGNPTTLPPPAKEPGDVGPAAFDEFEGRGREGGGR